MEEWCALENGIVCQVTACVANACDAHLTRGDVLEKKMDSQALGSPLVPESRHFPWKSGFTEWTFGPKLLRFFAKTKAERQNTI